MAALFVSQTTPVNEIQLCGQLIGKELCYSMSNFHFAMNNRAYLGKRPQICFFFFGFIIATKNGQYFFAFSTLLCAFQLSTQQFTVGF